tara:strand:- start:1155 stop:1802 length:648 start_codon:yes stop_codon:yes gene_type:complete
MTYLELVNNTLRRLRESTVATVADTDYSELIGIFVNDAIRYVESAWDWSVLRTTLSIDTVVGKNLYRLTDFGTRSEVLYVHNETSNTVVPQATLQRIRELSLGTNNAQGTIQYYALEGVDTNNDVQIRLHPTPNSIVTLSVYGVKRDTVLTTDTATTNLPSSVIEQFAFAYALRERGETGGQSAGEQVALAQADLTNAVALDANLRPEEITWNVN